MDKSYTLLALMRTPELRTATLKHWLNKPNAVNDYPFNHQQYCTLTNTQPNWTLVKRDLNWLSKSPKRQLINLFDHNYPQLLKELPNAPLFLFAEGDLSLLHTTQLAIVGSRNPTRYGLELAKDFAEALSTQGVTITSGLAIGIDGAAHQGALHSSGKTIGILGSGLDTIYPKSHLRLAQDIVEAGGLLLSEFPLGTSPLAWHFPKRNRIISGLSQGVLVVEATLGSGSLKTAEYALQQNREVFAIPGSVHSPLSRGCHSLIQQGAKLVNNLDDILIELPRLTHTESKKAIYQDISDSTHYLDHKTLEIYPLLSYIGYECTSVDQLLEGTGLEVGRLSADLLELELQGYIAGVPGGYVRTNSR